MTSEDTCPSPPVTKKKISRKRHTGAEWQAGQMHDGRVDPQAQMSALMAFLRLHVHTEMGRARTTGGGGN